MKLFIVLSLFLATAYAAEKQSPRPLTFVNAISKIKSDLNGLNVIQQSEKPNKAYGYAMKNGFSYDHFIFKVFSLFKLRFNQLK
jgi:hypothetical protein